ncbi:MAG: hypothetical protein AAB211_09505 [Pseudomonadota bacterium]
MAEHGPFAEIPGARAYVQRLHTSTTHRIAYATGGWGGSAQLKLSLAGFPVNGVFGTITYYGDGHWDAIAAKALGWQFVPVGKKLDGLTMYAPR